jgi:hypothetical protein
MNADTKIPWNTEFILTKCPPDYYFPTDANRKSFERHVNHFPLRGWLNSIKDDKILAVCCHSEGEKTAWLAHFNKNIIYFEHFDWLMT